MEPYSGPLEVEPTEDESIFAITVHYPRRAPRQFIAWLFFPSWELERQMHCLYAGDAQAAHVFEVPKSTPQNGPVIEETFADYIVASQFETDFDLSQFDSARCS